MGTEIAVVGFGGLALGLVLGLVAGFFYRGRNAREREDQLQSEVGEVKESFEAHKRKVTKHFERSSDLFRDLTRHYVSLYSHLSEGARDFCSDTSRAMRAELRALLEVGEPDEPESRVIEPGRAEASPGGPGPYPPGAAPPPGSEGWGPGGVGVDSVAGSGAPWPGRDRVDGGGPIGSASGRQPGLERPVAEPIDPDESIAAFFARVDRAAAQAEQIREHQSGYHWSSAGEHWAEAPAAGGAPSEPGSASRAAAIAHDDRAEDDFDDLFEPSPRRRPDADSGSRARPRERARRDRHAA